MNLILTLMSALLATASAAPTAYESNLHYINNVRQSGTRWKLDVNKFVTLAEPDFSKMFKGYSMTYDPNRMSSLLSDMGVPASWEDQSRTKSNAVVAGRSLLSGLWRAKWRRSQGLQ
jgi:transcriptional antiterminator Rof (Rho-off)